VVVGVFEGSVLIPAGQAINKASSRALSSFIKFSKMAGLSTTLIMETYMYILHTKQLYISRVRFLDLHPKPSSKNLPLSERMSVETCEWTAQGKAEVAYQLGNVNVQSIDPLLQLAGSPEEMWNIVAEICQGRAGGDNPLKHRHPSLPSNVFKVSATVSSWISSLEFIQVNRLGQMQARRQKASKSASRFLLHGFLTFQPHPTG